MSADVVDVARDTLRRHAMVAPGDTVLVAVSGGADSTALLHVLRALAPEWSLRLRVLHVDHGLRPDSEQDAEFVRALGRALDVPVTVVRVAIDARGSPEDAARRARYGALAEHAERVNAQRIAVGHTADDQAETVVMRLLQGTGVRGLAGIPFVRGRVIRPFLQVRRAWIVAYLNAAGLAWREDSTNRDPRFLRNRIRHHVLPALAAETGGDVVGALTRVAGHAREAVEAIDAAASLALARLGARSADAIVLSRRELAALPRPVAVGVLHQAAAGLGASAPLRAWAHRGLARALAVPPPRRGVRLGGATIEVSGDRLRVARAAPPPVRERSWPVPSRLALPEVDLEIDARIVSGAGYIAPRDPRVAAFDADQLSSPLLVRARRAGDRFRPFGGPGERRLKRLFIDAKVPRWERGRVPVVEAAGQIAWIAGLRRGALAPVTADTRRVLELTLKPLAKQPA